MADYRKVPVKFQNQGVIQRLDSDFLVDGQFYDMKNATSIKEGTLTSRFGSARLSPAIGSVIHTLDVFELEAARNKQFMYIGEGTDIYRARMDQLTSTPTNMGAALPAWGQRWSAVKMDAGLAARPYFFIAASRMLKDSALTNTGAATTSFQNWGVMPPPSAPATALAAEVALTITNTPSTTTWTAAPDESYTFKGSSGTGSAITLLGSSVDLSQFNSTTPSGSAGNGYDSGDLIELTIQPRNPSRFEYFILQFEVSSTSGDWNDYYEKVIVPNRLAGEDTNPLTAAAQRAALSNAGVLGYGSSLVPVTEPDGSVKFVVAEADNESDRSRPVELPQTRADDSGTGPVIKVAIPKNAFMRVGAASQTGKTWANIKAVRLWAKSAVVGSVDLTLTFTSLRMVGGSGLYNAKPGLAPYEWAYTYRNDATGHESNPSPLMVDGRYMRDLDRRAVSLSSIVQSSDSQVGSIGIYRRGGTLGQDFRLVGYVTNGTATFTDTLADSDLIYSKLLEFDNDPPVTSKMPTAFMASFTGDGNTGNRTISVTIVQPAGQTAQQVLTVGTRLLVQDNERTEWVQVQSISGNDITVNFQAPHHGVIRLYTSSVVGVPCRFSARAGMSVFLAGDQNNPSMLYKSKSGRPESFPVVVDGTESVNQIMVGSPSNPILGLGEYGGEVVCLNRYAIFVVRVFNGQMQDPIQTPSQRGVVCEGGWCRGENELYFLSDDGVYRWAGGAAEKISAQVDWFFRGKTVNGRAPMDRTVAALEYVKMAFHQGELHLVCRDTNGATVKWVYNPVGGGRWCPHEPALEGGSSYAAWSTLLSFQDKLYAGRYFTSSGTTAYLYEEEVGYRDNGFAIPFVAQTGFYVMGNPSMNKQWGDVVVELESTVDLTVKTYYNFDATTPDQTLTISGASGRRRVPLPINTGSAKEAYAIGFRFEGGSSESAPIALHSITFTVLDLAEIQRGRASDWLDGGYPFDKRLDQLIVEYDTEGTTVTLNLDTISGIAGNTQTLNVAAFTLSGAGRAKQNFPIKRTSDGTAVICKMFRFRPTATSTDFKIFNIDATFEKHPPDTLLFTEPSDLGYMCEKVFRTVTLDMDTGGTVCGVGVWVDGVNVATFSHTGTAVDRVRTYSFVGNMTNTLVIGRLVQLRFTPHASGKNQVYDVKYEFTREPCAKTFFDTFEQYFGSNGFKYMKQAWFEYRSEGQITVKFYRDGGTLFYSKVLPQQSYRGVQRFYLPAINGGVLNKSHSYRITIESNTVGQHFYLYRDSTRIETMNLSGDSRSAYSQHYLWDEMPIQK